MERECPFCAPSKSQVHPEGVRTDLVRVQLDAYPLAPGHLLITPLRHVGRVSELSADEHTALFETVRTCLNDAQLGAVFTEGANIGVNDGQYAGQTIGHVHVHLIPRTKGDVPDPRGGVRWVIPSKANYWDNSASKQ